MLFSEGVGTANSVPIPESTGRLYVTLFTQNRLGKEIKIKWLAFTEGKL